MTTIRARCPRCGEVGLSPAEIELRVDRSGGDLSFYAFTCPSCLSLVRKPADGQVVRLLTSGGVTVVDYHPRLNESGPDGPAAVPGAHCRAFSPDDVLDFHTLLSRPDWFERLLDVDRRADLG